MSVQLYLGAIGVTVIVVFLLSMLSYRGFRNDFNEKVKSDITLKEMQTLEQRIKQFMNEYNLHDNADVFQIAEVLNVRQGGNEKGLCTQACLKNGNRSGEKIVVFKEGLSEKERHFVFAHELAHLLNGDTIPVTRPNGRNKARIEQLADYTAAALLMPMDEMYDSLKKCNYLTLSGRQRTIIIKKFCQKYNVTEIIALRRVKEVFALK